jgi:hypothetical protein
MVHHLRLLDSFQFLEYEELQLTLSANWCALVWSWGASASIVRKLNFDSCDWRAGSKRKGICFAAKLTYEVCVSSVCVAMFNPDNAGKESGM